MFRTFASLAAGVALALGASAPAEAFSIIPFTSGSGSIVSGTSYVCSSGNLGPGVIRGCPTIAAPATLTAVPKAEPFGHWRFVRWDGADCGTEPTCRIETDGFGSPIAVFEDPVPPTITPTVEHSLTRDRTVTLGWTSDEWAAVTCTVQGAPLASCPDSQSVTLSEGAYTFTARGKDLSDNLSSPVSKSFRILDTELVSAPTSTSNARTAVFTVSTGLGTTFDCTFDNRRLPACATRGADGTGTVTLPNLADGSHTLRVYARDGQDVDYVPATHTWTVDTVAPDVTLVAHPDASFTFASADATARFECAIDGAAFDACPPAVRPGAGPGEHRIAVRAVDRAGNVSAVATETWTVAAVVEEVRPNAKPAAPATLSALAGKRKVSRTRTVDLATLTCPVGAACAITAPKTATVKIAGKRYKVTVTKRGSRLGLKLTKAAYTKLKGRTGTVSLTIGATATGASPTSLKVTATLRR